MLSGRIVKLRKTCRSSERTAGYRLARSGRFTGISRLIELRLARPHVFLGAPPPRRRAVQPKRPVSGPFGRLLGVFLEASQNRCRGPDHCLNGDRSRQSPRRPILERLTRRRRFFGPFHPTECRGVPRNPALPLLQPVLSYISLTRALLPSRPPPPSGSPRICLRSRRWSPVMPAPR